MLRICLLGAIAVVACGRSTVQRPRAVAAQVEVRARPWVEQVGGPFSAQAIGEAVALAPDGDAVVVFALQGDVDLGGTTFSRAAPITEGGLEGPRFAVVRYDAAGDLRWARPLHPDRCGMPDFAPSVRVTRGGEIVVVAGTNGAGGPFCLMKLDASGALVWSVSVHGSRGLPRLALASDGGIVVAATVLGPPGTVTAFAPDGTVRWESRLDLQIAEVAVDRDGAVRVLGRTSVDLDPATKARDDGALVSLGASGEETGRAILRADLSNSPMLYLAVDGLGATYVGWRSHEPRTNAFLLATVSADGTWSPPRTFPGLAQALLRSDGAGVVVLVGETTLGRAWTIEPIAGPTFPKIELHANGPDPRHQHFASAHLGIGDVAVSPTSIVAVGTFAHFGHFGLTAEPLRTSCKLEERYDGWAPVTVRKCAWAGFAAAYLRK